MARIVESDAGDFIENVPLTAVTRRDQLDALATANKANAANTIQALQNLGVGGDSRAALAKLTSGQTLTDNEKRVLGLSVTPATTAQTGNLVAKMLKTH